MPPSYWWRTHDPPEAGAKPRGRQRFDRVYSHKPRSHVPRLAAAGQELPQRGLLADPRGDRRFASAPALPPGADHHHGGRRPRAPHRVREHREPAARARDGAPARAQRARRPGRVADADRAAAAEREPAAVRSERCRLLFGSGQGILVQLSKSTNTVCSQSPARLALSRGHGGSPSRRPCCSGWAALRGHAVQPNDASRAGRGSWATTAPALERARRPASGPSMGLSSRRACRADVSRWHRLIPVRSPPILWPDSKRTRAVEPPTGRSFRPAGGGRGVPASPARVIGGHSDPRQTGTPHRAADALRSRRRSDHVITSSAPAGSGPTARR